MADGDVVRLAPAPGRPHPLGRNINHDPQSRNYAVTAPAELVLPTTDFRHRRYGACVDQDGIGECVVGAMAHIFNMHPNRAHFGTPCFKTAWLEPTYHEVTGMDPYPGQYPPDDTGTDANSALKWARDRGLIPAWEWAFGSAQGLASLPAAPFMQGTVWTDDMFHPDADGRVHPTGGEAGGHETVVCGYERRSKLTRDDDRVWCLNDWGTPAQPWGVCFGTNCVGNYFYLTLPDWLDLIDNRKGDLARPRWA